MLPGLIVRPPIVTVGGPWYSEFSFLDSWSATNNSSNYTATSQTFGAEDADRWILLWVGATDFEASSVSISSVTIGGVSAGSPLVTQQFTVFSNDTTILSLYAAKVPTGTTGNIFVQFGSTFDRIGLAWYRLVSADGPAAYDTDNDITDVSGVYSLSLDTPDDGILLAAHASYNGSTTTWSRGIEDAEFDIETNDYFACMSDEPTSAAIGATLTVTDADSTPTGGVVCAATLTGAS